MTPVGQSLRTAGKHALLRKITGREVAVACNQKRRYAMIDLCAGDGRNADSSGTCSPNILIGHRDWALGRGATAAVVLVERADAAFTELQAKYPDETVINCDARYLPDFLDEKWLGDDYLFIQNDPNTINDWALSETVLSWAPRLTTTYSTLGCNVGGLKRLPPDQRKPWYDRLDSVISHMPRHHDALLISLTGDPSQWSYLVTGPQVWRDRYQKDATDAFRNVHHKDLTMFWYKRDTSEFCQLVDVLFLQASERRGS